MNKIEFYNACVAFYHATGQGVPGFLRTKVGDRVIDSLIEDGLLKSVITTFNTLPDDETLCLTKGYCVEETMASKDISCLSYVRFYKGLEQGLEDIGGLTNEVLAKNPSFMERYNKWLEESRAELEEVIEPLPLGGIRDKEGFLNVEESTYLKNNKVWRKNMSISESLNHLREVIDLTEKIIDLSKKLMALSKGEEKHKEIYNKSITDIESSRNELKIIYRINDVLMVAPDKSVPIQDFYNSLTD